MQIFLLFFFLFYFLWLLLRKSFLFNFRSFGSQTSFFIRILIVFWVKLQLICILVPKPDLFFIYICIRIAFIIDTEFFVINTRLLYIGTVDLFKLSFFKIRNKFKFCILELFKPLLGCHFSYINCSHTLDCRIYATIYDFYSYNCLCNYQITRLIKIL